MSLSSEQRQELIRLLEASEDISPEWARLLFPPEKREYELVYHGKEREEDIITDTLAVPLQPVRTFCRSSKGSDQDWHNMLIFGDNLQVMKTLLEMKKQGKLCNADGTPGVRLIYIDPPFATKQEFEGSQDQKAYQDKVIGVEFLDFLRSRLIFMRELLAENGHIFVHVDYRKGHYIKTILDEIFREDNFRNEIILLVEFVTLPDDIILDTFVGSGTTMAVAEKLGRRWIGIDCGKLAIYTMQKRMLNLRAEIGNKGSKLVPRPFTLYNAGLYDFSKLKELPWEDWRFFALQLFQCRDESHKIGGIEFDGYRQGVSVLVFKHTDPRHKDARITEDTIQEIHEAVGSRVGRKVFIIAPALTFDFQQDYIDFDKVRYYALRIPYSIIHELHRREFTALKQPSDEMAVNDTVEAVGFDFIHTPELKYRTGTEKAEGQLFEYAFIKIETFKSDAIVREPFKKKGNLETLSMVMLDLDYNEESKVFDLDEVHYAETIEKDGWKVRFLKSRIGEKVMDVFLDIYGNEARVMINKGAIGKKELNKETKGAK